MTPYSEYQELDAGPDATIQSRYIKDLENLQAKATYWDVYCSTDPSAPECKVYDNWLSIKTMSRTEQRFLSVCNELFIYRSMGDKPALAIAMTEWRKLHDDLGEERAIELIRELKDARS